RRPLPSRSARGRRGPAKRFSELAEPRVTATAAPQMQNASVTATPVELHVISDATGETAARLVQALEAQFPDQPFREVRHPRVETVTELKQAVSLARGRPAVVVYTLVEPELREAMRLL